MVVFVLVLVTRSLSPVHHDQHKKIRSLMILSIQRISTFNVLKFIVGRNKKWLNRSERLKGPILYDADLSSVGESCSGVGIRGPSWHPLVRIYLIHKPTHNNQWLFWACTFRRRRCIVSRKVLHIQRRQRIHASHRRVHQQRCLKRRDRAGKSAIAQTIAEMCENEMILLASFFFSRNDPSCSNVNSLIATIAYQITLNLPRVRDAILRTIERDPLVFSKLSQSKSTPSS